MRETQNPHLTEPPALGYPTHLTGRTSLGPFTPNTPISRSCRSRVKAPGLNYQCNPQNNLNAHKVDSHLGPGHAGKAQTRMTQNKLKALSAAVPNTPKQSSKLTTHSKHLNSHSKQGKRLQAERVSFRWLEATWCPTLLNLLDTYPECLQVT